MAVIVFIIWLFNLRIYKCFPVRAIEMKRGLLSVGGNMQHSFKQRESDV
jgi:hypothetical protein